MGTLIAEVSASAPKMNIVLGKEVTFDRPTPNEAAHC
jgi:hypothetical protein